MDKPTSQDLPHLLSRVNHDNRSATENALRDELQNSEMAYRLGRAFLLGRLHGFLKHQQEDWPCETADECNLYAGGYQYDDQDDGEILQLLSKMVGDPEVGDPQQIEHVHGLISRLGELVKEEKDTGLTLKMVDERSD